MVVGMAAVEGDTGNCGAGGAGTWGCHGGSEGTEAGVLFVGKEGVEIFSGWALVFHGCYGECVTSDVRRHICFCARELAHPYFPAFFFFVL